jgi:hypothetical protein
MNTIATTELVRSAVLGILVSDASAMGVHWIYSQGKISQIAKQHDGRVEFLEPEETNYKGVPAFFAHPHKSAGDSSSYGEYVYILLRSLSSNGFESGAYIRAFSEYFGIGGEYVGYADGPMRETIYNITKLGKEIRRKVLDTESSLEDDRKGIAAHYISRYFFEFDTEGLKETLRAPLKLQEFSKEELAAVDALVDAVSSIPKSIGPDDDQMPALSRSAVLAHFYAGDELDEKVEEAVRITNDNDDAVGYSKFLARILRSLYEAGRPAAADAPGTLRELIDEHRGVLSEKARALVEQALEMPALDHRGATKTFGAACHVHMAVPLVIHLLLNTTSFTEANRYNILSSGDNCGRAIMLGALAGALYGTGGEAGIPDEWIDRCTIVERSKTTEGGRLILGG